MACHTTCAQTVMRVPTTPVGTTSFLSPELNLVQHTHGTWRTHALQSRSPLQHRAPLKSPRHPGLARSEAGHQHQKNTPAERDTKGWGLDVASLARRAAGSVVAVALAGALLSAPGETALAADVLKTCSCLLQSCRGELLRCLGDVKCAANIACLQACNGRPDETECQIGCGDLFANEVVDKFNFCAITEHPCVPQKPDENRYPVPPASALVKEFEVARMEGPWFISAGQNPVFDTFDCQLHTFKPTGDKSFSVDITWRIRTPDGGFFTRSALQDFIQVEDNPALLLNHDNEFLHYQDDWYIISSKVDGSRDDYFLVYYKGTNDAWDGYGGAVLYTRSKTVPPAIVPEVSRAAKAVGLDFDRFILTDNTCGPQQPLLARLEKKVEETVVGVENKVLEVGKEELKLLMNLGKGLEELQKDKDLFLAKLSKEEMEVIKQMEGASMGGADDIEDLFGNSIPLRRPGR